MRKCSCSTGAVCSPCTSSCVSQARQRHRLSVVLHTSKRKGSLPTSQPQLQVRSKQTSYQGNRKLTAADLNCPHFHECSGCSTSTSLANQSVHVAAREFFAAHSIKSFKVNLGPAQGWRCRAKLAVRGRPGRVNVGLFKEHTHDVSSIPSCVIHHPRVNEAAALITQLANQLRVSVYDDQNNAEGLRYLQLTATSSQGQADRDLQAQIQVVLVSSSAELQGSSATQCKELAQAIWTYAGVPLGGRPALVHSVWLNLQPDGSSNAVMGRAWTHLHGPPHMWQGFGGVPICLGPGSFVQSNFGAMRAALCVLQSWVPEGSRCCEMHAGVGTIGLTLLSKPGLITHLTCVEVNPTCEEPFKLSLKALRSRLPAAQAVSVAYHVEDAGARPAQLWAGCDLVISDPPRRGLEPGLLAALTQPAAPGSPSRLIYLSCGFDALVADSSALMAAGWKLVDATSFVFFPGTNTIESLVLFERTCDLLTKKDMP